MQACIGRIKDFIVHDLLLSEHNCKANIDIVVRCIIAL